MPNTFNPEKHLKLLGAWAFVAAIGYLLVSLFPYMSYALRIVSLTIIFALFIYTFFLIVLEGRQINNYLSQPSPHQILSIIVKAGLLIIIAGFISSDIASTSDSHIPSPLHHSININKLSKQFNLGTTIYCTSNLSPALTAVNDDLYIGWIGTVDREINIALYHTRSGIWEKTFKVKESSSNSSSVLATSNVSPALTAVNDDLYIGWIGTVDREINIALYHSGIWEKSFKVKESSSNSSSVLATSNVSPALAVTNNNQLYLAWTGTDTRLNIAQYNPNNTIQHDSTNFLKPNNSSEINNLGFGPPRSNVSPALAVTNNNQLYLAWTGTDTRLNIAQYSLKDGQYNPSNLLKTSILSEPSNLGYVPETSNVSPALAAANNNQLYIAWTGTDENLNITSYPLAHLVKPINSAEASAISRTLAGSKQYLYLAWIEEGPREYIILNLYS